MCTVTWMRQDDGYLLLCNRDERTTRQPALGPQTNQRNQVTYIAPVDGDHGGSWIGVSQFGVSLCLLNRYGDNSIDETKEYTSRGLLLIALLDAQDTNEISSRINEIDVSKFRPFTLLALSRQPPSIIFEWTGLTGAVNLNAENLVPLTSTSHTEPDIAIERRRQFAQLVAEEGLNPESLERFHRSHLPARSAYSVCMHRTGANTVSFSKVRVTGKDIEFVYEAGSPCASAPVERVTLSLKHSKSAGN